MGEVWKATMSIMTSWKLKAKITKLLKSVNSNFTLTVHSPKLNHAKTHFLSHFGEKKRKTMARPRFETKISRSEVDRANYYSIGHLFEI